MIGGNETNKVRSRQDRSLGHDSSLHRSGGEKPKSKKQFKNDSEGHSISGKPIRMDSLDDSNRSPSLFEEMSVGQTLGQMREEITGTQNSGKKQHPNQNNWNNLTSLQQATNQNAVIRGNLL